MGLHAPPRLADVSDNGDRQTDGRTDRQQQVRDVVCSSLNQSLQGGPNPVMTPLLTCYLLMKMATNLCTTPYPVRIHYFSFEQA